MRFGAEDHACGDAGGAARKKCRKRGAGRWALERGEEWVLARGSLGGLGGGAFVSWNRYVWVEGEKRGKEKLTRRPRC